MSERGLLHSDCSVRYWMRNFDRKRCLAVSNHRTGGVSSDTTIDCESDDDNRDECQHGQRDESLWIDGCAILGGPSANGHIF